MDFEEEQQQQRWPGSGRQGYREVLPCYLSLFIDFQQLYLFMVVSFLWLYLLYLFMVVPFLWLYLFMIVPFMVIPFCVLRWGVLPGLL